MSIHSFEVTKTSGTKTKLTEYEGKVLRGKFNHNRFYFSAVFLIM